MKFRLLVAMIVALTLTAMGCSSDSDDAAEDPAAVVADYLEVFNAEDGEAVMVFYAEDAVIEGHPNDASDGLATSTSEILAIETSMNGHQGSTGTLEYINMEVSGDTVTFDNIFINSVGDCFSSTGSVITVEDDKIVLLVWGDIDADLC
jgi:ketosteroid isomerase-like protein